MKNFLLAVTALFLVISGAQCQSIEKVWEFESITSEGSALFEINPEVDRMILEDGRFEYDLSAKDNLHAEGDYIYQNNLLVFFYSKPTDTVRRYRVKNLTESALVFTENNVDYGFKASADSPLIHSDNRVRNWQLNQNLIYLDYERDKDSIVTEQPFLKGREFLSLNSDGSYNAILSNAYKEGFWIQNNNLLVLKQKVPVVIDQYFEIVEEPDNKLVLRNGNNVLSFVAEGHPDFVPEQEISDTIIESQGFSLKSLGRGALGMLTLLVLSFLLSKNRRAINWRTVIFGLLAQLILAVGVLKVPFVQRIFEIIGEFFVLILDFTRSGSEFLLGGFMDVSSYGFIFLFQILPTIIFFSALTSLLFYLGIIQKVVKALAWLLTKLLGISGAESLSVAGNIFLGQTESPLMIKAYLEKMTKSEILLVMVGGMATVAGGVLAAYIGFLGGEDEALRIFYAKHLLTASVMAAPGAIVISKILYPQTEKIDSDIKITQDNIGSNVLDAIANGTTEGLKLAANVGAMLLVFIAFIALFNYGFDKIGGVTGINNWIAANTPYAVLSLEFLLGYVFAPVMWLIGVAQEDMALMGQLLGIKLAASEFVGYIQLAELKNVANVSHFKYEKSVIMATYMLCGFANFASIGIQIGGIGSLAPGQRKTLSEFGIRALIGGTVASLLSATIAGMIIG